MFSLQRLGKIDTNEPTGCLYGLMYDGTLLVVGLSLEFFENEQKTYRQLLLNLPAEIELCGVIKFSETLSIESKPKEIFQVTFFYINNFIIIICNFSHFYLIHDLIL